MLQFDIDIQYKKYKNIIKLFKSEYFSKFELANDDKLIKAIRDFHPNLDLICKGLVKTKLSKCGRKIDKYILLAFMHLLEYDSFTNNTLDSWMFDISKLPAQSQYDTLYLSDLVERQYFNKDINGVFTRGERFLFPYTFSSKSHSKIFEKDNSTKMRKIKSKTKQV